MEKNDINVYVGRWDLLPEEWEGINGLYEKTEEEIRQEVSRQVDLEEEDYYIAIYTLEEFEDTFNQSLTHFIDSKTYWVKFF